MYKSLLRRVAATATLAALAAPLLLAPLAAQSQTPPAPSSLPSTDSTKGRRDPTRERPDTTRHSRPDSTRRWRPDSTFRPDSTWRDSVWRDSTGNMRKHPYRDSLSGKGKPDKSKEHSPRKKPLSNGGKR